MPDTALAQRPMQPPPSLPMSCDVVVVGAGLAGLACTRRLAAKGVDVLLLEAQDRVGGRMRTDRVDGFLLDHGFQVLNPGYPLVPKALDLPALRLRPFSAGAVVSLGGRRYRVADPRRHPAATLDTVRAPVGTLREKLAFVRWALGAGLRRPSDTLDLPDEPYGRTLSAAGIDGRLRHSLIEPFLAGVLAEDDQQTSRRLVELLVRSFIQGTPALPAGGMQAVPNQMAAALPPGVLRVGTPVSSTFHGPREVLVDSPAGVVAVRAVVVATDPPAAADILHLSPSPDMNGLTTFWHAADECPAGDGTATYLHLDGDRRGPVVNSAVVSAVAPEYAPPGQSLIASTVLGARGDEDTERAVREQLGRIYGTDTRSWRLLRVDAIAHALPKSAPPLPGHLPVDLGEGRFVAGDYRHTASTQGALASGLRAASAVLDHLHAGHLHGGHLDGRRAGGS